eukprot:3872997-Amphidinium_carterae.1
MNNDLQVATDIKRSLRDTSFGDDWKLGHMDSKQQSRSRLSSELHITETVPFSVIFSQGALEGVAASAAISTSISIAAVRADISNVHT